MQQRAVPPAAAKDQHGSDHSSSTDWTSDDSWENIAEEETSDNSSESEQRRTVTLRGFVSASEEFHRRVGVRSTSLTGETDASTPGNATATRRLKRRVTAPIINANTLGGAWIVLAVVSDTLLISGTVMFIIDIRAVEFASRTLLVMQQFAFGLGTCGSCFMLVSYMRHSPRLYFLIEAMYRGIPRVMVFLVINVLPIFFGFALFGVTMFNYSPDFRSVDQASITLVSVIGGDALMTIFRRISGTETTFVAVLGNCYLTLYAALFIYAVLNVALAVVQESFYFVKRKFRIMQNHQDKEALRAAYRRYKRQRRSMFVPSTGA